MMSLKGNSKRHLIDVVVQFILDGGNPATLLGRCVLEDQYELLRKALELAGSPEAAGKVQAWISKKGTIFQKCGFDR